MGRYWIGLYFAVVFSALFVLYLPTFANPPHVDYWEAFYTFHGAGNWSALRTFITIINHDPWQDGTFRPFSYLFLYLEYNLFAGNFVWNHVINFLLYCLSVILLYRLAISLALDRLPTVVLLAVFIFLFPHSGILTLTFHQFALIGFSAFLGGFILYLRWLRTKKFRFLIVGGLLFLTGMFCYEAFDFWPLAIVILRLLYRERGVQHTGDTPNNGCRYDVAMLVLVYLIYLAVFRLTRTASVTTGPLPDITAVGVLLSLCAAFFNLAYTGIFLNLFPFLASPCRFADWVELGGPVTRIPDYSLPAYIIVGGAVTAVLIGIGGWFPYRRKKLTALLTLSFLLYLYISNFSTIFLARIPLGDLHHILVQFRYQYVPDALLVLVGATLLTTALPRKKLGRTIARILLVWVLVANVAVSHQVAMEVNRHLAPLNRVLNRIREGIASGEINTQNRLYIQRGITDYLPRLCWHKGIGRKTQGSYEWGFPPDERDCFTLSRREAAWILDSPLGIYRRNEDEGK